MMQRRYFLAVAAAVFPAAIAQAQSFQAGQDLGGVGSGQLTIAGEAPQACVLSAPAQTAVNNATLVAGPNAAQVRVTQLVNPVTAVPNAANIEMAFPVVCNSAHRVVVRTAQGALVPAAPVAAPGPGIANRLAYQVSATWAGQQVTAASDAAPVAIASNDGATGVLSLSIQVPGGGQPLLAGPYADSLLVELQPAN